MDSVIAVANEIILAEAAAGRSLDQIRLQKLVFYVHLYAALEGLDTEQIHFVAWERGPVSQKLRNFMLGLPNRHKVYRLQDPLSPERVQDRALRAAIAFVIAAVGHLPTHEIVEFSHQNSLYTNTQRDGVINMMEAKKSAILLGAANEIIQTPVHSTPTTEEQKAIDRLNLSAYREEAVEYLAETNYPLLMSLVIEGRNTLSARALADVLQEIARNWWDAPKEAISMLLVGLYSDSALQQESALKGLASILESDDDEEAEISSTELVSLKEQIKAALVRVKAEILNPILLPYLEKTYRGVLNSA